MNLEISIVIPALNEAVKIGRDIAAAGEFIRDQGMTGEVIVVDDGSRDHTAAVARRTFVPVGVVKNIIQLDKNMGKGFAVKTGIKASSGRAVLVADSGLCVPFSDCLRPLAWILEDQCQIATGSRLHPGTIIRRNRPLSRRIVSRLFHRAAVMIARLPKGLKDSQCGFKLYDGKTARELFPECRLAGYLFEVEILVNAVKKGCLIREFPIHWTHDPDTRLKLRGQFSAVIKDLLFIRKIF